MPVFLYEIQYLFVLLYEEGLLPLETVVSNVSMKLSIRGWNN